MSNKKGFLIGFSVVDGAGKSTQVKLLHQSLSKQGFNCIMHDIYERKFYSLTNRIYAETDLRRIYSLDTAEILMVCDEIIQYEKKVRPLINKGYTVLSARSLSDRYLKSILYNANNVNDIKKLCLLTVAPDLHFFLQAKLDTILKRISIRGTDSENPEIMKSYIKIANDEAIKQDWKIINSDGEINSIQNEIFCNVNKYLSSRKGIYNV